MKKFKELTEGMNKKVPVYHEPDKLGEYPLVGHVHSSATSIGAAKLAGKKSATLKRIDGKYGWVASDNLKESKYGDAMTSRLPAHLDDPRVESKKVVKKPVKRDPKDHSWKLFREEAALDAALDGIYVLIAEELTPREKKSSAERLEDKPEPPLDHALEDKKELEKVQTQKEKDTKENLKEGSYSGSLQQAVAHAKQHGHRITYGTNSRKWHSIDSADRDFKSPFSYDPHDEKAVNKAAKFWDPKSLKETTDVILNEDYKVGDKVVAKIGPHKGQVHTVIHVHPTGHLNIKPEVHVSRNRYHQGAAKADPKDVDRAPIHEGKKVDTKGKKKFVPDPKIWKKMPGLSKLLGVKLGESTGINRKTVQEVFQAAKDKKKVDFLQNDEHDDQTTPQAGTGEPNVTQDGGEPKPEKKNNRLKPENAGKSKKLEVKGPGVEDKFQTDPIVTPLTTMPDTASPKSGSQGVR